MLSSITPLGQRGRGSSWRRTVVGFWIGAVFAGIVLFTSVALIGGLFGVSSLNPWFSLVVLGAALVLDLLGVRPPGPQRQVDEDWLNRYRDWVVGMGYGAQLGFAFMTIVPTFGTWAIVLVASSVSPWIALAMGASFGVGRGILLLSTRSVRSTPALSERMRAFIGAERRARMLSYAGYAVVFVVVGFNVI